VIPDRMKSSEWWMLRFTAIGAVGVVIAMGGRVVGCRPVELAGWGLLAPFVLAQAGILLVALPIALCTRWREKRAAAKPSESLRGRNERRPRLD
jgi:hypothetical protein